MTAATLAAAAAVPIVHRPPSATDGNVSAAGRPSVLLCTADVGCGHARAASAIMLAIRRARPDLCPEMLDVLTCAPQWFNHVYRDAYIAAAKRFPRLNGWLYETMDVAGVPAHRGLAAAIESHAMRHFCNGELVRRADVIICTHFLCARVLSKRREQGLLRARRLAVVVTDQHPHACWRVPHADLFLVASDAAADEMVRHGVDRVRVRVTGIPIDLRFDRPMARGLARRLLNLPDDRPIVLLTGGGLGLGGIDEAFEALLAAGGNHYTIVVCGKNDKLRERIAGRAGASRQRDCRVIGLTTKMHELMAAADLMVGKPGGLTTSEAAARGLPMVLLRPIPGQEEHNADALVAAGAAVRRDVPALAGSCAAALARRPADLAEMSGRAKATGRPAAARDVAAAVLQSWMSPVAS